MAQPLYALEGVVRLRRAGRHSFRLEVPALEIAAGARLALLGPSGSGKSTLLDMLALALRPDEGRRFVFAPAGAARDVLAGWERGGDALDPLRARAIGYVLQTGGLLPFLTVRENIALPAAIGSVASAGRVETLARRLGVAAQLDKRPEALSVGQRQRVAIARALVHRPAVVLADEPIASVDPQMGAEVLDLLLSETAAEGAALIMATHDHAAVARHALPVATFASRLDGEETHAVVRLR